MNKLKPITTRNIERLKKTYHDIGTFYIRLSTGEDSISARFRDMSVLYMKSSVNLDRLFEDGSLLGNNSYNSISRDLEYAYNNIVKIDIDSSMLILIREAHDIIDKVPVKN